MFASKGASGAWLLPIIALWILATLFVTLAPGILPRVAGQFAPILLATLFAFLHGHRRYGAKAILLFFVIAMIVSNIFENASIVTGFPFGKYHHLDWGLKIFLVPWPVGLVFFSISYLGLCLAETLLGTDIREENGVARVRYR